MRVLYSLIFMILFSIFHLLLMLYMIGYVFVFHHKYNNYLGDILYYTICFVIILTWFMNNSNCILTIYNVDKPTEKMDIYDVHQLLPFLSDIQMKNFVNFVICGTIVNLILIHLRSHLLPMYVLVGFIIIYSVYLLYLRHFYNEIIYNQLHLDEKTETFFTSVSSVYIIYCLFLLYLRL